MHSFATELRKASKEDLKGSDGKTPNVEGKSEGPGGGIMSAGQEFAVSALAAGLAHVIHHPLYTLKSQMMFYGPDFRITRFFQQTVQHKHNFLYRGLVSRTFGIMPEKAFKMQGWIIVGRYMESHFEQPTIIKWLIAGAAAGAATTIIGCPSERAMVQAHIQKQGFMAVIRVSGLRGLYHGFLSTLYRDISFNMSFFTTRELIVRAYCSWFEAPDPWKRVLLGIPAGCMASVVACPMDVVKTRLQGSELGGQSKSVSRIIFEIAKKEGPRHLFKGLVPRLVAVPSMMSVFYVINEELEKLLLGKEFPK